MYKDAKSWSPDFIQKKPDGSLIAGGRWMGGRAWLVCAPKQLELAQRAQNLPEVQRLFAPNAYFIDTTYAVGPQECHDPKHPLTYADDIRWKQRLSDYAREVFGLFGSECGREWAIPHSDFFEELSGVSGKYFHYIDPASLGATVIPLFEMVYHDCVVVFGKYGYSPLGAAEYVLHHALCGRTLHYHSLPKHLYWQERDKAGAQVKARPSVAAVSQISDRRFQIKYRWDVEGDGTGDDWRVFVHFGAGEPILFQNDHALSLPVSTWRAGEVIEEGPFEVSIPEKVTAEAVDVFMGLCRGPGGAERAVLPDCGMDGRVLVGRLRLKPSIAFEKVEPKSLVRDPSCFARADNGWAEGLCLTDRFLKNTHEVLSPLAELTAHSRLVRFEFLTPDRSVRRATFGSPPVATITANFGTDVFIAKSEAGGDVALPAYGLLIESSSFTAFHALSWAGRRYEKPVLFTIRQDSQRKRFFHGFGDARITWRGRELEVKREARQ